MSAARAAAVETAHGAKCIRCGKATVCAVYEDTQDVWLETGKDTCEVEVAICTACLKAGIKAIEGEP